MKKALPTKEEVESIKKEASVVFSSLQEKFQGATAEISSLFDTLESKLKDVYHEK